MSSPERPPLSVNFSHAPPEEPSANTPLPPEEQSVTKELPPGALPETPAGEAVSPSQLDKLDGYDWF